MSNIKNPQNNPLKNPAPVHRSKDRLCLLSVPTHRSIRGGQGGRTAV